METNKMKILTEKDIIKNYPKRNFSLTYLKYQKLKPKYPNSSYWKLSKLLNEPEHRTRYWHTKNSLPQPIITINYLKQRNLLPLTLNNKKLPIIARILGTTFGDGGIFQNLNAIFLSSSELQAVKEFSKDLNTIFGKEIKNNSRIIEGGVYGHSYCYQNTNRKIIRFFQALKAPIGRKSNINLKIPEWIFKKEQIADEFFGAFLGNELGTPTIHKDRNKLTSLDIGLTTKDGFLQNRIEFLKQVELYLNNKNIKTNEICISNQKDKKLLRLLISKKFDNYERFIQNINLKYCKYKTEKLINTYNSFIELKRNKIKELKNKINPLTKQPYSDLWIKNNLRLSQKSYNLLKNEN